MKHRPFILLIVVLAAGWAFWRFNRVTIAPTRQTAGETAVVKPAVPTSEPPPSVSTPEARPPANVPQSPPARTISSPPSPQPDTPPVAPEPGIRPTTVAVSPGSTAVSRIPPKSPTIPPASPIPPTPPTSPPTSVPPEGAKPATKVTPAAIKAELEEVRMMFQEFRNSMGENPVGNNAEITKALLGDNLKQVRALLPRGSSINEEGQMCDPQGIPYFFHQLSGKEMEIRSAGPDREMWSDDDIITK